MKHLLMFNQNFYVKKMMTVTTWVENDEPESEVYFSHFLLSNCLRIWQWTEIFELTSFFAVFGPRQIACLKIWFCTIHHTTESNKKMMDKQTGKPTRPLFTTFPEKYVMQTFLELLKWNARFVFVCRKMFLIKFTSDLFLFVWAILFIRNSS